MGTLSEADVNYIIENPYQQLVVDIDATNLGHIIEQVTANAAQYTQSGTVRTRYDYIGRRLMISVEDTGQGISQDILNRIYERFAAGPNKGSGLGLPICKELTEQMGGTMDISSEEGLGNCADRKQGDRIVRPALRSADRRRRDRGCAYIHC